MRWPRRRWTSPHASVAARVWRPAPTARAICSPAPNSATCHCCRTDNRNARAALDRWARKQKPNSGHAHSTANARKYARQGFLSPRSPRSITSNAAPGRLESPADSMLDAAAKAVQQADPTTPGAGLLPDVDYQRATSAVVAKAAYRAAVEDTKWLREYHQRVLQ
jgi:hypothetical protein